ncbi:MAG: restriction endonuclease subunit S [Oscillospiraceae bacterium]|nr:restriction endonuclease subunit S [Oscillospiraceae bacterium]
MTPEVRDRIEQIRCRNVPDGYKTTRKGIVPNEWTVQQIRDFAVISSGSTPNRGNPAYWNGDIPWVTTGELEGGYITKTDESITMQALSETSLRVYPVGTLLMAMYGQGKTRGTVAKLGIEATVNQACAAISLKEGDSEFVFYALQNAYNDIRKLSNTGNQENLNADIIKTFFVIFPPVAEQQKIAEILTTQDKVIELKEKLLAEKQRQKKYLMQQLLTGKKRLPGYEDKWKYTELGKIAKKERAKNRNFIYDLVLSNSAQHGIIPQTDQFDKEIASEDRIDGYYIVHDGFFVYNPRISATAPCGPINRNETGKTGVMSPLYTVFSIESKIINTDFLRQYFSSSCWYSHMKSVANYGARHDRMNVSEDDFFLMPIPFPSIEEQTMISNALMAADKEIDLLRRSIEQEKQKKKALMQLLLTGIVRVNV